MKQSGRASWIMIVALVSVLAVTGMFLFAGESPQTACNRFFEHLAKGNVEGLVKDGYIEGMTPEEQKKKWDYAVNVAGPYFRFIWRIKNYVKANDTHAFVNLAITTQATDYEETYRIPMVRVDGRWRVDVRGMSRGIYPALP